MSRATSSRPERELARRISGGIEVTLYWCPTDNNTRVEIWQPASEERLAFLVPGEQALHAFYHPFAHIPLTLGELSRPRTAGART